MVYTITQINGIGFIVQESEWEDFQPYFDSNNYEAFMFCEKEELQEQSFLVYYYFICEKASLIFNQLHLVGNQSNLFDNDTSIRCMDDYRFKENIEETKRIFHLNGYRQCGYWSILTSFAVARMSNSTNSLIDPIIHSMDEFRDHYGYP